MFELWDRSCLSFRLQREPGILPRRPRPARRLNTGARRLSPVATAAPLPWPRFRDPPLHRILPPTAAGGIGCVLLGYEDSCSLESSGSSGTRDAEPSDPLTPQPAPGDLGTAEGMLLDLAVKRPVVRSKIKVTARAPAFSSLVIG